MAHSAFISLVLEEFLSLLYVPGHCEVYLSLMVVPEEHDSNVTLSLPIIFYVIMLFEHLLQMVDVFVTYVFDPKVVDHQCELYWSHVVLPQSWYQFVLSISMFFESFFK